MNTPRPVTAWQLEQSVSLWQQLQAKLVDDPTLTPDETVTADPYQSAPTLPAPHALLAQLIDDAVWAGRRVAEADNLRKRMAARRDRYQEREDNIRATITQLLEVLNVKAWEGEEGTASIRKRPRSVVITDVDKLPADCVKVVTTPLVRDVIAPKLKAGETVPGAELSNSEMGLTIFPF